MSYSFILKEAAQAEYAKRLCQQLGLQCSERGIDFPYFELSESSLAWIADGISPALSVQLQQGKMAYRRDHISRSSEPLLRAIGWKANQTLTVVDATAGLGRDAVMMASAGCRVRLLERQAILYALLYDAIHRLQHNNDPLCERIDLYLSDSINELTHHVQQLSAQVIYLDPMYPHRKKSALVKYDLRLVRELAGTDPDSEQLLAAALATSAPRIVVKRPKGAAPLGHQTVSHTINAVNTRYDVYLRDS